jgi:iron complex transport system permease protein
MVALAVTPVLAGDRSIRARRVAFGLAGLLLLTSLLSLSHGASGVRLDLVLQSWLAGHDVPARDWLILWEIRLPRMLTGVLVGASLAVGGAVMQGLFRNPLADPGLVGVGAGAGLGAVLAIVLGGQAPALVAAWLGWNMVPVAAFMGGGGCPPWCFTASRPARGGHLPRRCCWRGSRLARWRGRQRGFWSMSPMIGNCAI